VKLWERSNGSSDDFMEMTDLTDHDGLPSEPKGQTLRFWESRAAGLYFLGATQDTQIRLRYQKSYPDLTDSTSPDSSGAGGPCLHCRRDGGSGAPQAERWDVDAIGATGNLVTHAAQREQQIGRRRRPFSSRAGFGPLI
jgi:hypothetical protein